MVQFGCCLEELCQAQEADPNDLPIRSLIQARLNLPRWDAVVPYSSVTETFVATEAVSHAQ